MAVVPCSQCGKELPLQAEHRFFLGDKRMCNFKCLHDAGSRAHCGPGCGCTGYAIKRRMLREHRELLRCMECIISENNLYEELDALWQNNRDPRITRDICLDHDPELDEESDASDPEQQLRNELADRSAMIEAVNGALECRRVRKRDGNGCRANTVLHASKG